MSETSRDAQLRHLAERFKELLNDCADADVMVVDGWGVTSVELSHLRLIAGESVERLRYSVGPEGGDWQAVEDWRLEAADGRD